MIGTSQLINAFGAPVCFTDTTDIFKDRSGVALYGLDYDASDAGGASGKFNEGAIFNGSSSKITLPTGSPFNDSDTIKAVSAWVKADTSTSRVYPLSISSTTNTNDYWYIGYMGDLNAIYIQTRDGSSSNQSIAYATITPDTGWHHIVVQLTATEKEIYLDGVKQTITNSNSGTGTNTSWISYPSYAGTVQGAIGILRLSSPQYSNGSIDQVRIYNTALTQSQVTQLSQENSSTVGTHLFGCIANYNLDGSAKESMGTTAYDGTETDITYRYDGTPTNVDFGVGGKSNYGARFDGSSGHIDVSSLKYLFDSKATATVSLWFNTSTTATTSVLFSDYASSSARNFLVHINSTGNIVWNTRYGSGAGRDSNITTTSTYNDGNWHHIVLSIDQAANAKSMYVDGSQIGSSIALPTATGESFDSTQRVTMGSSYNTGTPAYQDYYNGTIDQVRIFSKALSSGEVSKLYGNGAGEIACTYTSTTDNIALPITNTAYYKLDNNSKDSARSTGKFNEGAIFNGSSSGINLPSSLNTSVIDATGAFSISMWINANDLSTIQYLFAAGIANNIDLGINTNNLGTGKIVWTIYNTSYSYLISTTTITTNTWYNIIVTYNNGLRELFINGASQGTATKTLVENSTAPTLGYRNTGGSVHFNGEIDQVRIYDTALSSADASNLYAETASDTNTLSFPSGKTAIATYQLDGNSTDLSGNYNGTDTNITYAYDGAESNIEYRFGRYGQAAVFDGSSSYVNLNSAVLPASVFSVSFWVNVNSLVNEWVFSQYTGGVTGRFIFNITSTGGFQINVSSTNSLSTTNIPAITIGNWHHVVVVKDGSNGWTLYSDGSSHSTWNSSENIITNQNTILGGDDSVTSNNLDGKLDQVRIYDAALTSSQVSELYNEKPEADTSNFKTVLWDGNGSSQYISNVGFQPDLVWIKNRGVVTSHNLFDSIRGNKRIISNTTNAQVDLISYEPFGLPSFEENGFYIGDNYNGDYGLNGNPSGTYGSSSGYVAWCWKGGGDDVLNEEGTIDSQVSANTAAGFSIVKYTGNSTAGATVGHGLSQAPELIIGKRLVNSGGNWTVYAEPVGATAALQLNTTASALTATGYFNDTAPNNSVFTLGSNGNINNTEATIAYCFHSVAGYSSIGSYSGTGSTGNAITGLGFKPNWLMVKRTDASGGSWLIVDNRRVESDGDLSELFANTTTAETGTGYNIDFTSDGFTLNTTTTNANASGTDNYIYMAFK